METNNNQVSQPTAQSGNIIAKRCLIIKSFLGVVNKMVCIKLYLFDKNNCP